MTQTLARVALLLALAPAVAAAQSYHIDDLGAYGLGGRVPTLLDVTGPDGEAQLAAFWLEPQPDGGLYLMNPATLCRERLATKLNADRDDLFVFTMYREFRGRLWAFEYGFGWHDDTRHPAEFYAVTFQTCGTPIGR